MSSMYYIKAYYTKEGQQQPEIRRFAIDISPEKDVFTELQTKIASFQANCQLQDITLQYSDEENERITFSSNEELRSAIGLNKDSNTLKVFVTINQPITQQQSRQETDLKKEVHTDVTCDGCNNAVIGFRYKCFVCPNYDLCEKCSSAGVHSEHNMIRITKPGHFQHPFGPQGHPAPPSPHGFHHPHPHHPHHPHYRSFHGRRHRHTPSPPPAPFAPTNELLEQIQTQIPQWLPNRENTAHIRAHIQQHLDTLKSNTQTHMQNSKQYLENVGKYLQQTLSPFGIDCDYHVDEKPTTNSTTEQQQEEQPVTTTTTTTTSTTETTAGEEPKATDEILPPTELSAVPKYPDLLVQDNQQEQTASSSSSSSTIPTAESLSTKIRNPTEKAIDDCMERMKAMGFIDANGALRELIRSKQGDINAVLDAINPRHFQA